MALRIGIDIGSTTVKVVVLDAQNKLLFRSYERHYSKTRERTCETLRGLRGLLGGQQVQLLITGSAGLGVAKAAGLDFVQEVYATAAAVREFIPGTDAVIELGGEDAKIIFFGNTLEERMNGSCAGGTGAFIDQMATLLNVSVDELDELSLRHEKIYPIASRCGVFAKSDIQPILNQGGRKEDVAASIFQAVVDQTVAGLTQGRELKGKIVFLGGPLHFLMGLRQRFVETLKLDADHAVFPEDGDCFAAMGAALCSSDYGERSFDEVLDRLEKSVDSVGLVDTMPPLFDSQEEYDAFLTRHNAMHPPEVDIHTYTGAAWLGIDAGSTTTKIALITADGGLLYTYYHSNLGNPVAIVLEQLREIYKLCGSRITIKGAAVTGYGEDLIKNAFSCDAGLVETVAHYSAARHFNPDVDFIIDIGGQDMKCFFVKDGSIGNITLNEACSAGCGSFIQNFAEGLHMTPAEFAAKAIDSKAPVDLGTRCTVFMNSKVKQAQKEGADVADISAGIAFSVIKNALFKVMQLKDVRELGDHIVVQGGTFYNDAVLRCMEKLLDRDVIRPDIAGLMGAYGAAILAMEAAEEAGMQQSSLLSPDELDHFSVATSSYRCRGCGNKCLITMQKFPDGGKYFTGNRCERGIGGQKKDSDTPNIYQYKYERLFKYYEPLEQPVRGTIGLPRVLNMYEDYPFWFTFFTKLGYRVVLSGKSSAKMYFKGMATVPSDSLCYPAKIAHGHIMDLIEKGITKIFYPCEPYNMVDDKHPSENHYNCPIVASYAENIRGNMDILREKHIDFLQPFLPINDEKRMAARLYEELGAHEGLKKEEIVEAVDEAYKELAQYRQDVRDYGAKILERVEKTGEQVIMLVGRPYHIDPEINHGIPEMIQSYHLPIISEDAVYHVPVKAAKLKIVNQWSYHARLYHAAQFVAEHPNFTLIQFSSFGCGLDALTTGQVKDILEAHNRIYTMIKLDEVSNLGAARIRLRSLMAALARRKPVPYQEVKPIERPHFTAECKKTHTILAPQMAPIHFDLIKSVMRDFGYNLVVPEMPDKEAIDLGLRYVNNDMCYPSIVVIGQLIAALKSGEYDPDHTSIAMFQTCGACRATNYMSVLRQALKYAGFPQVPVFAVHGLPEETDAFRLTRPMLIAAIKAAIFGDLLQNVKNRMMPYELQKGETQRLFDKWMAKCKDVLRDGGYFKFQRTIKQIVKEFDNIPIDEELWKPKVGIVGEILAKYHPVANNHIEKVLMEEGAEVVMPDFVDFFLYSAYDPIVKHRLLDGKKRNSFFGRMFINIINFYRAPMRKALKNSRHFLAPHKIDETAKLASRHVSLGNMAGEGWFLTGEMVKLIDEGVPNVICLQPFGCLPNHITGKGVMHELRESYTGANLTAIDCDAGSSEVNQLNRIKLMLAVAKERGPKQEKDEEKSSEGMRG